MKSRYLILPFLALGPANVYASDTSIGAQESRVQHAPAVGSSTLRYLAASQTVRGGSSLETSLRTLAAVRGQAGTSAIARARHRFTHTTGNGSTIVVLRQMVEGIDVLHGDLKVLLDDAGTVKVISGVLHPTKSSATFTLDSEEAVRVAIGTYFQTERVGSLPLEANGQDTGGYSRYELSGHPWIQFDAPARVKQVFAPVGDSLEPAYVVELQARVGGSRQADAVEVVVSANDGKELERRSLINYESFQYRVWAEVDGDHRPLDNPADDHTPHPTGFPDPDSGPEGFVDPVLVEMEGFNQFQDPWLPEGATQTIGNNASAYVDHDDVDGINDADFYGEVTQPGVFDWVYDVYADPIADQTQSMASIVQIFYTVNWLHDYWYDSGFDEEAGNAQEDNYGRGGAEGDPLKLEAQNSALSGPVNNANMSTPADGMQPRMQMFLYNGLRHSELTIEPLAETFAVGTANFGPANFDLSAEIMLVDDGVETATDGCEPIVNNVAEKIALIDRGACSFETKITHAEEAGALGVLIANNDPDSGAMTLGADADLEDPTLPAFGISMASGDMLKQALLLETQTAHMLLETGINRDGTLENMVVAHEWGHYLHNRLTDCSNQMCRAQGEGWGDFLTLHTVLREGDNLDGTYGRPIYTRSEPSGYFGNRRVAYSVDPTKNTLSFRHISDGEPLPDDIPLNPKTHPNSEVHRAGEVWTSMLFEAYVGLHKNDSDFEAVKRRMSEYIVSGMILAPPAPTYTEQRDAVLAAIYADSPEEYLIVAKAFASRGAGSCAISPPRFSTDFVGVVEDFELRPRGEVVSATIDDAADSCDDDGTLDVDELGTITIEVLNSGAASLAGASVEVTSDLLIFPEGNTVDIPTLDIFESGTVTIPVRVPDDMESFVHTTFTVSLTTPSGCEVGDEKLVATTFNGDVELSASVFDDVEPPVSAWTAAGEEADEIWSRRYLDNGHGFAWHGEDKGYATDSWLVTPAMEVAEDEEFYLNVEHAYSFEASGAIYWDGGVIEISLNDGESWVDVSDYVDPGYPIVIVSQANILHTRPAFGGSSPGYPALQELALNFGLALAGETVRVRFRIGTDAYSGDTGWDIDNIEVGGILGTPFHTWVEDPGCMTDTGSDTDSGSETDTTDTDDGSNTDTDTNASDTSDTNDSSNTTAGPTDGGSDSETSESEVGTDSDTGDQVSDGGCGCRSNDSGYPAGLFALAILGLVRRRSGRVV